VLHIEDSEDDAELVAATLRRAGYDLDYQRLDTREAMEQALVQTTWDVVLSDHHMPQFGAPQALEVLQRSGHDLPFIIVSGAIGEELAVGAMKAGAHDYVNKDSLARLIPAIARELREAELRRANRRAEQRTTALLDIARDINGRLDFDEVLDRVQRRTAEVLPCDFVVTFRHDASSDTMRLLSHWGIPPARVGDAEKLALDRETTIRMLLESGEPAVLNDLNDQPWLSPRFISHFDLGALAAVPLRLHGMYVGAFVAANRCGGSRFDAEQVALFEGIAHQLAVALEAAELFRAQRDEAAIAAALAHVSRELIALDSTPKLLDRLCQLTAEVLGCDCSATLLYEAKKGCVPQASYGLSAGEWGAVRTLALPRIEYARLFNDAVPREAISPWSVCSTIDGGEPFARQLGVRAALYTGLRRGEELIGVQVAWSRDRSLRFTARHERVAQGVGQAASLALENARLIEELQQADRLKSDFVATMSHELRTPLNIIMGYNELLLEGSFGPVTADQQDGLERIRKNTSTLLDLITATLDLSRMAAGKMPVDVAPVNVAALMAEIRDEMAPLCAQPSVAVGWDIAPDLVVQSDRSKLKTVVRNLLGNALKFTPEGHICIRARESAGGIELTVADTGIGIALKALPIIFEPFRQVDSSATRRYGGVGIGLHIASRFVALLRGTIDVESEEGRGSTFRVWIPAVIEPVAPSADWARG